VNLSENRLHLNIITRKSGKSECAMRNVPELIVTKYNNFPKLAQAQQHQIQALVTLILII
jgi:hypothetical protein